MNRLFLASTFPLLCIACKSSSREQKDEQPANTVPLIHYTIKKKLPHDTTSFTEGLLVHNGQLFESTGSPEDMPQTRSEFGFVDTATGKIDVKGKLDRSVYFGEGVVFLKDKLYQLTYENKVGFVYDAHTFKRIRQFSFTNAQGWGLTTDGASLIMSDGTPVITWLDPANLSPIKKLTVTENGTPLEKINELEYINGYIYANVYTTADIVKIDPGTGKVVSKLELSLVKLEAQNQYAHSMEMNGIAYDAVNGKVYVTGKMWPSVYEIEFAY